MSLSVEVSRNSTLLLIGCPYLRNDAMRYYDGYDLRERLAACSKICDPYDLSREAVDCHIQSQLESVAFSPHLGPVKWNEQLRFPARL